METTEATPHRRVLGRSIGNCANETVILIGKCVSMDSSCLKMSVKTTDDVMVNCVLSSVLQEIPNGKIVELEGVVSSNNEIKAISPPVIFTQAQTEKFDTELYTEALKIAERDGLLHAAA